MILWMQKPMVNLDKPALKMPSHRKNLTENITNSFKLKDIPAKSPSETDN